MGPAAASEPRTLPDPASASAAGTVQSAYAPASHEARSGPPPALAPCVPRVLAPGTSLTTTVERTCASYPSAICQDRAAAEVPTWVCPRWAGSRFRQPRGPADILIQRLSRVQSSLVELVIIRGRLWHSHHRRSGGNRPLWSTRHSGDHLLSAGRGAGRRPSSTALGVVSLPSTTCRTPLQGSLASSILVEQRCSSTARSRCIPRAPSSASRPSTTS